MVNINTVRTVNESLVKAQPIVAVFVGATGGIGEASIRALAATHSTRGKGLRAYIIGRNASAAQKIISDCERICPPGQFRFLKAEDLSLLENVDLVCEELMSAEKKEEESGHGKAMIDFLVQTQAYLVFGEARKGMCFIQIPSFLLLPSSSEQ
jgi:NAD(P)-dependent dehydrogenase (short-subunit alcohol dehydrogenase family)